MPNHFHNVDSWVVWNDHPYILWSWQQGAQWVQRFVWLRGKVARCVPSTLYLAFTRCRCTTLRTGTMWKSDKTWMVPVASRSGRKARPVDNRFKGSLIGVIMLNWWPRNVWSVLRSALRDPCFWWDAEFIGIQISNVKQTIYDVVVLLSEVYYLPHPASTSLG